MAMWNKEKLGLSLCTEILGIRNKKQALHERVVSQVSISGKISVSTAYREDSGN